jgi:putative aminopeptidase FrvX
MAEEKKRRRDPWVVYAIQETIVDANTGEVTETSAYGVRRPDRKTLLYDLERMHKAVCVGSTDLDEKGGVYVLAKCLKKEGILSRECLKPVNIFIEFQEEE